MSHILIIDQRVQESGRRLRLALAAALVDYTERARLAATTTESRRKMLRDLLIEQHPGGDGVLRLAVAGEVDTDSANQLEAAIDDAIYREQIRVLCVDLNEVTFIDSMAIRVLLAGHAAAGEHGIALRITRPQDLVRTVLDITGVLAMLTEPV